MLESILAALALLTLLIFFMDVRRKRIGHSRVVQKERDAISEMTHSTAAMGTFSDGGITEVILGASEDSGLFFYRRIDKGTLVLHYTLRIPSLTSITLQINGEKRDFAFDSSHLTAQMRATDIARQARQGIPYEELVKFKNIRLTIFFRSEEGSEKNISVTMHNATQRSNIEVLSKIFENAVWWQQYLYNLSQRKSERETLTFQKN